MSDVGTIYLRLRLVDEWMNEWMQMQCNECNAMQWMFEQFEQRVFWINKYFPNNVVGPFMFLFFAVCDVDRCSWRPFLHRAELRTIRVTTDNTHDYYVRGQCVQFVNSVQCKKKKLFC